jgi:ATP-dependent Clp protease adaptor protein ClpS|tara:strand:- start:9793 stop:10122 length:330 start_codon:yes stop_codon:yes gene_type:complete
MSDDQIKISSDYNEGILVGEVNSKKVEPPNYQVLLLNDDFTPMDFVVEVLESLFSMDRNNATKIMLEVHSKGKGLCGVYTYEIAETKVAQVTALAKKNQHPLLCTMEKA